MKSLYEYLIESSMFKDPEMASNNYDLKKTFEQLATEDTFTDGFRVLESYLEDITKEHTDVKDVEDDDCYVILSFNTQTDNLKDQPFSVTLLMTNQDKTVLYGGRIEDIDGTVAVPKFYTGEVDGCVPTEIIESLEQGDILNNNIYWISEETANSLMRHVDNSGIKKIEKTNEEQATQATPANTLGAGDPCLPGEGGEDGSGDLLTVPTLKPKDRTKKKKKKTKEQIKNEEE